MRLTIEAVQESIAEVQAAEDARSPRRVSTVSVPAECAGSWGTLLDSIADGRTDGVTALFARVVAGKRECSADEVAAAVGRAFPGSAAVAIEYAHDGLADVRCLISSDALPRAAGGADLLAAGDALRAELGMRVRRMRRGRATHVALVADVAKSVERGTRLGRGRAGLRASLSCDGIAAADSGRDAVYFLPGTRRRPVRGDELPFETRAAARRDRCS